MVESDINPDDWKAALTYYNAFDEDRKRGKMPIYQTNQTYKDLINHHKMDEINSNKKQRLLK